MDLSRGHEGGDGGGRRKTGKPQRRRGRREGGRRGSRRGEEAGEKEEKKMKKKKERSEGRMKEGSQCEATNERKHVYSQDKKIGLKKKHER